MPGSSLLKILDSVDSTNNYAMDRIHAGLANHGMGWFAREQTQGKGQRGKSWEMTRDQNIAMSIIIDPAGLPAGKQFHLSMAIAEACFSFFSAYAGPGCSIKWPNDLYYNDRKAGGILIENIFHGREWKWAVAGIGININQQEFGGHLKNPVSLKQITGRNYDTVGLATELHGLVLEKAELMHDGTAEELHKKYNSHLYKLGEKVKLRKENMVFETRVEGVTINGQLQTSDSVEREFGFGEVEWVI
jgi:BirA family biotin operon repressor/biotin-[acetyl-CoA-carboxylase] ligase